MDGTRRELTPWERRILWLAQGCGTGTVPVAPGTVGSAAGLLWFFLLCAGANGWVFCCGTLAGIGVAVWFCGEAERILQERDPGSVVLDEIVALPVCYLFWLLAEQARLGHWPGLADLGWARSWWVVLVIWVAFRFFDILKPWPVRQSQALPGGWGVVVDDLLAALYVNLLGLAVWGLERVYVG